MLENLKQKKNEDEMKKITPREVDYSCWYLGVIAAADLAENAPVRGCMTIKPYGYAIWENIKNQMDEMLKDIGVENAYSGVFFATRS